MNKLLLVLFFLMSSIVLSFGLTTNVTLAWNQSISASVDRYNIYCGTNSRIYNTITIVQASQTNSDNLGWGVVTNLTVGKRYYFAVAAVTSYGLSSEYSDEVAYTVVNDTNLPYASNISNLFVYMDHSIPITLRGYDPYTNVHAFRLLSQPTKGTISGEVTNGSIVTGQTLNIIYSADKNIFGYDAFKYSAWNGRESLPANVGIVILNSNMVSMDQIWSIVGTNSGTYTNEEYWAETNLDGVITSHEIGEITNYTNIIRNLDYLVVGWEPSKGILQFNTNLNVDAWLDYPNTNNPIYLNPYEYPQCFFRLKETH